MKNYLFIITWIIYISFYLTQKDVNFILYLKSITYWKEILSYINALFWIITWIWVLWLIDKYIDNVFKKSKSSHFIKIVDKMMFLFQYITSIYIWLYLAILPLKIEKVINKFFFIFVLIIFLYFITSFIDLFFKSEQAKKSKFTNISKHLFPFLSKIINISIWIIWIITIISNLGYDVSALVAWAWIWGIAVALAAQKSLTNIFWAVTILLNKPFKVWDMIILSGTTWTVKDIWLTYLTLQDRLWHQVMIPNESILTWKVENLSVRENRRTEFKIWLVYLTTLEKVKEWVSIIENILEKYASEKTIWEYRVNFDMFWNFSLDLSITYFSLLNNDYIKYLKQKEEINLEIKKSLANAKIEIAYPTQELIIKDWKLK